MKTKTTIMLGAVLALAGCSKQSSENDPIARCRGAVERGVDATMAKRMQMGAMAKNPDAQQLVDSVAPKLKESLTALCVEDKWPETVITCLDTAADIVKCKDGLTSEQRGRYTRTTMEVMAQINPGRVLPGQLKRPPEPATK